MQEFCVHERHGVLIATLEPAHMRICKSLHRCDMGGGRNATMSHRASMDLELSGTRPPG